jgi:hypothetical protein
MLRVSGRLEKIHAETLPNRNHPRSGLARPLKPDIHCVTTHWIRGFMAFQLGRRARAAMLMVPM